MAQNKLRTTRILFLIIFLFHTSLTAQERKSSWQRQASPQLLDLQLFHSPQVANLPTAETLQKGDFEFEISHRFIPRISTGHTALWGLDGPVHMRFALGYAPSNRLIVTLGRSNSSDNLDLWLKYKCLQLRSKSSPILGAFKLGSSWNTSPPFPVSDRATTEIRNFQLYGQFILNTLIKKKLGLGVVPSYLYNSDIRFSNETKDTFTLGFYSQYYFAQMWSFFAEWNPFIAGYLNEYNPFAIGIELETGGHFFKIFVGNSSQINTAQYLAGSDLNFTADNLRLAFTITRLLKFAGKK